MTLNPCGGDGSANLHPGQRPWIPGVLGGQLAGWAGVLMGKEFPTAAVGPTYPTCLVPRATGGRGPDASSSHSVCLLRRPPLSQVARGWSRGGAKAKGKVQGEEEVRRDASLLVGRWKENPRSV